MTSKSTQRRASLTPIVAAPSPFVSPGPVIIAHRGASAFAPENTIPSFLLAVDRGATMVEFDVHLTSDGRVVVIHDASLQRTTGVRAVVQRLPARLIMGMDAGAWFSESYRGVTIPSLSDVLTALDGRVALNVELKGGPQRLYAGIESRVIRLIRRKGVHHRVLISSFHVRYLERVRQQDATVALGILVRPWSMETALARADRVRAWSIHPSARVMTPALVGRLHDRGYRVLPHTVDSAEDKRRMLEMGADGFFTNAP